MEHSQSCYLCPRNCGVDRRYERGFCGAGSKVKIALVSLHKWEEPCLIGTDGRGAGTVFFSYCNLRCCYCQNHAISHEGSGFEVTEERLAQIFLEQQARGAATLDLVTPTHYVDSISRALDSAKKQGFNLPVVYNSSGYENEATLELLRGKVAIFMPDLKYKSAASAQKYSQARDYFPVTAKAIKKMVEIAGPIKWHDNGQMRSGVLVRHLILPGHRHESMELIKWLWSEFGDTIQLSLMNQYTPLYKATQFKNLQRKLTTFEYESVVDYALSLGITNCYIQEGGTVSESFVPQFDGTRVIFDK